MNRTNSPILIIDDDPAVRSSLSLLLESEGFATCSAEKEGPALKILNTTPVALVIMDMNFSMQTTGQEGLALLGEVKDRWPEIPVVLLTAWGSIGLAVEGMKKGAFDFITKPWDNRQLLAAVKTALQLQNKKDRSLSGRVELDKLYDFTETTGTAPAMVELLSTLGRVAVTDAPVLIQGESGTGKELLAEAVHQNSPRKDGPFIKVNMGAIASSLFESEMFGHKKGAFTDAVRDRTGRFRAADKGTIFLDEVGELDLASQVKLLRVLQEKRFEPVGDSQTITVDFRVVCATNKDLKLMVEEGTFREDLYYRINLITVEAPPLRERREDIPLLVEQFLKNSEKEYSKGPFTLQPAAMDFLKKQPYPGNVRELKNLVERVALLSGENELRLSDFQQHTTLMKNKATNQLPEVGSITLEEIEKTMIIKALEAHPGNYSRAAGVLGLNRGQLYNRMQKFGLGPYSGK